MNISATAINATARIVLGGVLLSACAEVDPMFASSDAAAIADAHLDTAKPLPKPDASTGAHDSGPSDSSVNPGGDSGPTQADSGPSADSGTSTCQGAPRALGGQELCCTAAENVLCVGASDQSDCDTMCTTCLAQSACSGSGPLCCSKPQGQGQPQGDTCSPASVAPGQGQGQGEYCK